MKADNQVVIDEGNETRVEVRVEHESVWRKVVREIEHYNLVAKNKVVMIRLIENMLALPVSQED